MSGKDEKPRQAITYDDYWELIEPQFNTYATERGWSDMETRFQKLVVKYEIIKKMREENEREGRET